MIHSLSILIPVYNHDCSVLVKTLHEQASSIPSLQFEILVYDDASSSEDAMKRNRLIRDLAHCNLIELPENIGRSRIRNMLAQAASFAHLLFLDSDVQVPDGFVANYLNADAEWAVVCGGASPIDANDMAFKQSDLRSNLRYRYELKAVPRFSVGNRQKHPYQGFRSTNFMVKRDVMLRCPFEERIRQYGYEDVLWGKLLQTQCITIKHIDNPVTVDDYEPNDAFLEKTLEGLHTLHFIAEEMQGYSSLLGTSNLIIRYHLRKTLLAGYRCISTMIRRNLTGKHPNVYLYNAFRLCEYLSLTNE